ncbi:MAG: gliding motility-associated ABC transporter substrate-binding protein GldG [Bacteroidales bacterium]|nr:gliding motility-associated ABC transporter substrate-binding protein GldG [Bacteroidales bacterium]
MFAIVKKEIRAFFAGPSAYLTGAVFLVLNVCVLFILPPPYNLFDSGFAAMDGFFEWMPFIFLFLIPALCMRGFAEEKKTGTLESLLTRPVPEAAIVGGKWLAVFILLLLFLLPAFLYRFCLSELASPPGNIDKAAFWGAFVGVLLLGAVFISISLCLSACTRNQMMAFILSAAACALFYRGFDALSRLPLFGRADLLTASLGLQYHYRSLSRGVIDIRDVAYCVILSAGFFGLTAWRIARQKPSLKRPAVRLAGLLVLSGIGAAVWGGRWDLTADKRYTLLPVTKDILKQYETPVLVKVYLTGDLPAAFKRMEKSLRELLDEFRLYRSDLRYRFVDIYESESAKSDALVRELMEKGLEPTQLEVKTKEGMTRRLIFPCAELTIGDRTLPINLLQPQLGQDAQSTLNRSVENLELQLIQAIRLMEDPPAQRVAFLEGHGEWPFGRTLSVGKALSLFYRTERWAFGDTTPLEAYDLLIMARPTEAFSEAEKYRIDQYIMQGGKMLWLIDPGNAQMDSLRRKEEDLALLYPLNWEEVWFRYGFRIRNELVLDLNACPSPVVTGYMGNRPLIEFIPNVYRPVLLPVDSAVGRQLEPLCGEFAAGVDTIGNDIVKRPLLQTSAHTRRVPLPHAVSADLMREQIDPGCFDGGVQTVGWWLEGRFESAFKARRPETADFTSAFRARSEPTAMVVIGDGDLIRNDFDPRSGEALPAGFDAYAGRLYGNQDFLIRTVHLLCGHPEWIPLRERQIAWRLLDAARVEQTRGRWTVVLAAVPVALLFALGFGLGQLRKKNFR